MPLPISIIIWLAAAICVFYAGFRLGRQSAKQAILRMLVRMSCSAHEVGALERVQVKVKELP